MNAVREELLRVVRLSRRYVEQLREEGVTHTAKPTGRNAARPSQAPTVESAARIPKNPEKETLHFPEEELARAAREAAACTRCPLSEGRKKVVFGEGSARARLIIIGEAPGAQEDIQGRPFVGRAGKKLDEILMAVDLRREEVYITNVVKCRPPGNRDPQPGEIALCNPHLEKQLGLVRPDVILALGSPAARTLLDTAAGITRLRGVWHDYKGVPLMATFHPAYVLRNYTKDVRGKVWEDIRKVKRLLDEKKAEAGRET